MKPKTDNKKKKKKKKSKKKFILIPLLLIIAGAIIFVAVNKYKTNKLVKVATVSEVAASVWSNEESLYVEGKLTKGFVQTVKYSETKVEKYHIKNGDTVKKGDILLSYDTSSLKLNLEEQKSQLKIAENNIRIASIRIDKMKKLKIKPEESTTEVPQEIPTLSEIPENSSREDNNEILPDTPPIPETVNRVNKDTLPLDGDGSEDNPYVFFVSGQEITVDKAYMMYLADKETTEIPTSTTIPVETATQSKTEISSVTATVPTEIPTQSPTDGVGSPQNFRYAVFNVCNENNKVLYSWFADGSKITEEYQQNWNLTEGIEITQDGQIRVKQNTCPFATLITYFSDNENSEDIQDTMDYSAYMQNNTISPETMDTFIENYLQNNNNYPEIENYPQGTENLLQDYVYTAEEIKKMIDETEQQKEQLEFGKRATELLIRQTESMLKTGTEQAVIDGKVTFVANSDKQAKQRGYHILVTNDKTATVTTTLSIEDLFFVSVGTKAEIEYEESNSANETKSCDATVTEISDEIIENTPAVLRTSAEDTDNEYYEAILVLDGSISTSEDSRLFVSFKTDTDKNIIRLPSCFVRNDNGKYYVMMANSQNILEKKYIETGRLGETVEVLSGITRNDRIALPYGKAIEGALTVDAEYSEIEQGNSLFF